jgi:hypothetical protein
MCYIFNFVFYVCVLCKLSHFLCTHVQSGALLLYFHGNSQGIKERADKQYLGILETVCL